MIEHEAATGIAALSADRQVLDPGGLRLGPLTPAEIVWMADLRDHLRPAGSTPLTVSRIARVFDHYNADWSANEPSARWNPGYLISSIGVALGDALVAAHEGAHWLRVVAENPPVIAVRIDELRKTVFPIDAVARRWHAGQRGWVADWFAEVLGEVTGEPAGE